MDVLVLDAARSPIGQAFGALRNWHPAELLARVLDSLVERSDLEPQIIDAVVAACSVTVGEQALNVGRNAVLGAGWPESVPAHTIDGGVAGAGHALQSAMGLIESGRAQAIVVAGVESASRVPAGASTGVAVGKPFGALVHARYEELGGLASPASVIEALCAAHGIDRKALDEWAQASRERFAVTGRPIVPVDEKPNRPGEKRITADQMCEAADIEALKPMFESDGIVTAGNMARPGDCASAVILVSRELCERMSLSPLARVASVATLGASPIAGSDGAGVALRAVKDAGLSIGDPNTVSVYEDSAATPLAFIAGADVDASKVNRSGGALATADIGAAAIPAVIGDLARSGDGSSLAVFAGTASASTAVVLDLV